MSRLERISLVVSLLGCAIAPAHAQAPAPVAPPAERLTLNEAEQIALRGHPRIRAAEFTAAAADAAVNEQRSAYYPFVFGAVTGAGAETNSRIAAGGLSNPIIFDRFAQGLTVSQTLLDFGRTRNLVASSSLHARAAQQSVAATREEILLGVARTYFAALRAQQVLQVAQQTVAARQLVADQVNALAQNQLKSKLDVSFANVNLSEAKLFLVQAQNDQAAGFADLSAALGYPATRSFILSDEPLPPAPPADAGGLIQQALQQRPELARDRLNLDAAQRFARAERDLWFPTVSAVGSTGVVPIRDDDKLASRFAAGGLNITIPIFNGKLFNALSAEARYQASAEEQSLRDLENQITRDVQEAWLAANSAYQRLDLTAQLLQQASQALNLARARYDLGLGSIVELSQAQLNLTEAQIEQASARYEYQSAVASLDFQTGTLH